MRRARLLQPTEQSISPRTMPGHGLPGKSMIFPGLTSRNTCATGAWPRVAAYCETNVVNTYPVWLRYELFRGRVTRERFTGERGQPERLHTVPQQYQAASRLCSGPRNLRASELRPPSQETTSTRSCLSQQIRAAAGRDRARVFSGRARVPSGDE